MKTEPQLEPVTQPSAYLAQLDAYRHLQLSLASTRRLLAADHDYQEFLHRRMAASMPATYKPRRLPTSDELEPEEEENLAAHARWDRRFKARTHGPR